MIGTRLGPSVTVGVEFPQPLQCFVPEAWSPSGRLLRGVEVDDSWLPEGFRRERSASVPIWLLEQLGPSAGTPGG